MPPSFGDNFRPPDIAPCRGRIPVVFAARNLDQYLSGFFPAQRASSGSSELFWDKVAYQYLLGFGQSITAGIRLWGFSTAAPSVDFERTALRSSAQRPLALYGRGGRERSRRGSSNDRLHRRPASWAIVLVLLPQVYRPRAPRVIDCRLGFSLLVQSRIQVSRERGRFTNFFTTPSCVDTNRRTRR